MIGLALLAAVALGSPRACTMASASTGKLAFTLAVQAGEISAADVTPIGSSAWPSTPMHGTEVAALKRVDAGTAFAFGDNRHVLQVSSDGVRRSATLIYVDKSGVIVPVAYGFCENDAAPTTAEGITTANPFDVGRWSESCMLLDRFGAIVDLRFRPQRDGRIEFSSARFQGETRVVPSKPLHSNSDERMSEFGDKGDTSSPTGTERFLIAGSVATILLNFKSFGGDDGKDAQVGWAICPIGHLMTKVERVH